MDLAGGVPQRPGHHVSGDGDRRRREYHVPEVSGREGRADARAAVGGDVELGVLVGGEGA